MTDPMSLELLARFIGVFIGVLAALELARWGMR